MVEKNHGAVNGITEESQELKRLSAGMHRAAGLFKT
jgi:hypothetical protein